ncbi:cystatin-like fold lipoprotein [Listeria seeligeri]|uniref:cystatin-like fold lipoprotein n=1 Tax=Listeria seeligeri TaxID=1640 RepID=UPI0022EAB938|nr:cystatin-like fold lipoprotein [Listeria seeligeri]
MKNILIVSLMLLTCMGILVACGEQDKYNEAINDCIKQQKKLSLSFTTETEQKEMDRDKSVVKVYDDGKYVYVHFLSNDNEGFFKQKSDGSYDMGTYDDEEYMENDAKLVYYEKNGKSQKIQN